MDVELEMTQLLNILPYRGIFTIEEPIYEEPLAYEFLATFEHHPDFVNFRLG